jgi:sortase (surface protein transpeptidase)
MAVPLRLLIPIIGVNAAIEQVGIADNGDLDTPSLSPWTDTGWYVDGPRPGEQGSAVIDGHLNQPGNYPAVFWRLYQLRAGNEAIVLDSNGKVWRFLVIDVAYYTPQNAPYQLIFGNTSGKYLNLITCAGDWIPSLQQTTERLVIYTRLI